jgi:multidrug resistance efflux pump
MVQFRMKALNQQQKPDDLDLLMKVTKRRGWLAVGTLAVAILGLLGWSFSGRVPVEVRSPGVLTTPDGTTRVDSTTAGQVTEVAVVAGDVIKAGDPVVTLRDGTGESVQLTATFSGTVTGVLVHAGNVIEVGSPLYLLQRSDLPDTRLLVYAFAPSGKGESLAAGMDVDLTVSSAPSAAFGVLRGRVTHVDPFPASKAEIVELLSDEQLAEGFTADGPPVVVTVDLVADPTTASGYEWSNGEGPPFPLGPGVEVTALIVQGEQRPIDLVFGR